MPVRSCRWCGVAVEPVETVVRDGEAWADEEGETVCELRVDGCPACDDGEAHPHAPA